MNKNERALQHNAFVYLDPKPIFMQRERQRVDRLCRMLSSTSKQRLESDTVLECLPEGAYRVTAQVMVGLSLGLPLHRFSLPESPTVTGWSGSMTSAGA